MHAAKGILTTRGGMTSHAAVVARGMGRACVAGAGEIRVDYASGVMSVRDKKIKAGEKITIDGATGEVFVGEVPTIQPELSGDFAELMGWADEFRTLGVRANADTPLDARTARRFGAEGIGLCRTEHMFFDAERIQAVREMIMAEDAEGRSKALAKIEPMQRNDFVELFRIMDGLPVTIRLLDPPLHEFVPHTDKDIADFAQAIGKDVAQVKQRVKRLEEFNPMLGHRGCRLAVTYPEIYEMQARAIFAAAAAVIKEGKPVEPEVMIPLIITRRELELMKELVVRAYEQVKDQTGIEVPYALGTMIELPRAALRAAELHEFNPMLGHRGCRLGITFPEIYEMQARAIFEAACDVAAASGEAPVPEVMIPLVATKRELEILRALVDRVASEVFAEKGRTLDYLVGTMIELPRAALMAGEIAEEARFFSFGTNDLTQTTLGLSRDDAGRFLGAYVDKGIFARDPFVSLDIDGVGQLVRLAAERGRATKPDIKLGICGEHGGDPASITFCEEVGLDYVSASPYRVPIARLAAAQAALRS
jgi:phosphoenolpyruvate synthase/pyruvate phosphate dikinase